MYRPARLLQSYNIKKQKIMIRGILAEMWEQSRFRRKSARIITFLKSAAGSTKNALAELRPGKSSRMLSALGVKRLEKKKQNVIMGK